MASIAQLGQIGQLTMEHVARRIAGGIVNGDKARAEKDFNQHLSTLNAAEAVWFAKLVQTEIEALQAVST
jgi:hypothetical protein